MSAINFLKPQVLSIIRDKGWKALTPIQERAIERIITTENNYILCAMTASGKTEAAFLPILSKVDFSTNGVKVLYISPLKALINDQMNRIEELCQELGIRVTKWHGDAKQSAKKNLINAPEGIVLMTPESLEAMFQHHPEYIGQLFKTLEYVIIDEMHYFLGTDRGTHLRSNLIRLKNYCSKPFLFIGLSATIGGDFASAKKFLGHPEDTIVINDKTPRPMKISIEYYPPQEGDDKKKLPEGMIKAISTKINDKKTLIFPNSRSRVEEISSRIKNKNNSSTSILTHHSSISKEERESVENTAKNSPDNIAVCCTSTLELGIDIGDVDQIIQVGAPPGTASLAQRAGRSGRRNGTAEISLYSSEPFDLLRTLATYQLCLRNEIEAPDNTIMWYNVVLFQIISIVKEKKELSIDDIVSLIENNAALSFATNDEILEIVNKLIDDGYLENLNGKIIIGADGNKLIGRMDSYTIFETPHNYRVMFDDKCIGELDPIMVIKQGATILLGGNTWEITCVEKDKFKVYVKPSTGGNKPMFISDVPVVSKDVENEMKRILLSGETYDILNDASAQVILDLQNDFSNHKTIGNENVPYYVNNTNLICVYPFSGTKIFNTLKLLFHAQTDDYKMTLNCSLEEFIGRSKGIIESVPEIVDILEKSINNGKYEIMAKYEKYLPIHLQAKMESTLKYDIDGTIKFLRNLVDGSNITLIPYDFWSNIEDNTNCQSNNCDFVKDDGVKLDGKVYVYSVFVSEGPFTTTRRESIMSNLLQSESWISHIAATYGKDVEFVNNTIGLEDDPIHCKSPKPFECPASELTPVEDIIALTQSATINGVEALAKDAGCSKYLILVFVNAQGRSYATHTNQSPYLGDAFIFYSNILKKNGLPSGVIAHEMLHLFGAYDLYEGWGNPNSNTAKIIRDEWPNDVMNLSHEEVEQLSISPFTAWAVGLTDEKEGWYNDFVA